MGLNVQNLCESINAIFIAVCILAFSHLHYSQTTTSGSSLTAAKLTFVLSTLKNVKSANYDIMASIINMITGTRALQQVALIINSNSATDATPNASCCADAVVARTKSLVDDVGENWKGLSSNHLNGGEQECSDPPGPPEAISSSAVNKDDPIPDEAKSRMDEAAV